MMGIGGGARWLPQKAMAIAWAGGDAPAQRWPSRNVTDVRSVFGRGLLFAEDADNQLAIDGA